jgi:nitrile hydratase
MNGVHDMGGEQGMGPIQYEKNEPVFHARWEGRVYAINRTLGAWGKWNLDASRHGVELIPPADYFRMSYYERWLERLISMSIKSGLVTREEVESGKPAPGSAKAAPPVTAANAERVALIRASARRPDAVTPRFAVGQQVRTRNMNPIGHTRLPRYARAKSGTIERDHGVFLFPDTTAHFLARSRSTSIRFVSRHGIVG